MSSMIFVSRVINPRLPGVYWPVCSWMTASVARKSAKKAACGLGARGPQR
ncbi:MAG: hypothetical protein IKG32_01290 [Clostridia bacterium]|nr:hypothetical protein [Clostridia bacterium]